MHRKLFFLLLLPVLAFGQMNLNNNTVKLSATGDVTWEYTHLFGVKEDTTVTPNCNGNGVYTKIIAKLTKTYTATSGLIENDGFTAAGDSITIITPGDYKLIYSFTMVGSTATDWKVAVFKNSVKQYGVRRTTTGATNYTGGTLPFYLKGLVAGDDISFKVTNLTNPYTDDPTFTNLNLLIEKIPE